MAETLATFDDGAVRVGSARDGLLELQLSLDSLRHGEPRIALEALIPHLRNLACEVLAEVVIECDFLNSYQREYWLQSVLHVAVAVSIESLELGQALGHLVLSERVQIEGGVVDGVVRDSQSSSYVHGVGVQLVEVDLLLANLLNFTCNGELYVVDGVWPYLVALYAGQQLQIARQLQSGHLGVDEFVDGHGDGSRCLDVALGVACGRVQQDGGAVGGLTIVHVLTEGHLVLAALLENLTNRLALGLLLAHLVQFVLVEHALNLGVQAVVLTQQCVVLVVLLFGERTVLTMCELVDLVELDQNLLMALLDFGFCLSHFVKRLRG